MASADARGRTPLLDIRLFGQIEVLVCGRDVTQLAGRRAMLLIASLALLDGKPIERHQLAGRLWPDSSDAAALHNLRQTLAALRRSLGKAGGLIVNLAPRSLAICSSSEVWIDALEFDRACAEGSMDSLKRAVELYREPLLSRCDEPFAVSARMEREVAFVDAADRLAKHFAAAEEHVLAAALLRRSLSVNPYLERTCRALMQNLGDCGEASAALESYRDFRHRLRRDLRTEPDAETKALYRAIRQKMLFSNVPVRSEPADRLPVQINSLIGRESDIEHVACLLDRCRLVTLTGVGGVGKTRLGIAVAAALRNRFMDGVRFVDLAPLQSGGMVATAIAGAVDIQERAATPLHRQFAESLKGRELLLVIDNCEHVGDAVAEVIDGLLSSVSGLRAIATSRQPLGVNGELVWPVPPLPAPAPITRDVREFDEFKRTEYLLGFDSVRLFSDRSRTSARPAPVPLAVLEVIGSICRKLDGIPLAIEAAAARTNVLSVSEIERRLDDRFALLAYGARSPERHRSLQAAVEWSWLMLSDPERRLLMRMSVFRGGCTLEAIEAVDAGRADTLPVLDRISSLVDRSLVNTRLDGEGSRISMLETIRQYAEEKLRESGEDERAADAHCDFFLSLAEEFRANPSGPDETLTFQGLETEHDNLRAALRWCHTRHTPGKALRLALSLCRFWDTHGHLTEGRAQIEAALRLDQDSGLEDLVSTAHLHAGWMATVQRDCAVARGHYEKALAVYRSQGCQPAIAKALNCLGFAFLNEEDYSSAKAAFREALDIARQIGMSGAAATALGNLAEVALAEDECETARNCIEQSIAEAGGLSGRDPQPRGQLLCALSLTDFRQGDFAKAGEHAREALRLFTGAGLLVDIPGALSQIAVVVSSLGEHAKAARLLAASEELAASQGAPLSSLLTRARHEAVENARAALGEEGFKVAFRDGGSLSMSEAIALAST